jgi:S-adenosylmethionine:tRNA ribosyltransferase-isomerase
MNPQLLSIADFTYQLPEDRIAKYPLAERDQSKLLVYRNGLISEDIYQHIASHIPADSLLVFNNTKVVEARLLFQKPTGGVIEIFCLEPDAQYPDITTAMLQTGKVLWQCLVGGASKWKPGQVLEKRIGTGSKAIVLTATYIEKKSDSFIIELSWQPSSFSFAEILHAAGAVPLPPYIKRTVEESDKERYQTVYAKYDGSVAAPTAGLHFTETILTDLEKKRIKKDFVALHVGAGTFKPVKAEIMQEHEMHAEFIEVNKETIENILANVSNSIIAVGTTSLRTMESLYWLGLKAGNQELGVGSPGHLLCVSQWEPYELEQQSVPAGIALQSLLDWMQKNKLKKLIAKTQIILAPGYQPKIAKALVTNFHQPGSTLLLLVAALIGEKWRIVYDYALKNDFRFLSYGDGSLLWFDQA